MSDVDFGARYSDVEVLEQNEVGVQALATDVESGRRVIVTRLSEAAASSSELESLQERTQAMSDASSGAVAAVARIDETEDGGKVLEWATAVQGTLQSRLKSSGAFSLEELLPIGVQTLRSLGAFGASPHLALSPSLLGIPSDSDAEHGLVVFGAGINTLLPSYSPRDKNTPFFGSPEFMAPELCGGKEASPQSDLYAVALVLYTLVTGKPPFKSSRASTTLKRQIYEKPLPLKLVKPGVTGIADFEAVLQRALEKEPGKRYGDASEFLDALVAFAGEHFPGVGLEGGAVDAIAAPAPAENVVEESADDEVEVAEEVDVEMESADSDEESSVSEESDDSSEEPEAMVIGPDEEADLRILVESGALSVDSKVRREGENQIRTVGELLEENASKDSEDDDVEAEDIEDEIASSIEEDESTEALDEVEQAEEDESEPDDDDDSDEVAPEEDTEGEDGIDEAEGSSADDGDELDSETDGDDGDDDAWFSEDDEDFGAGIGASGGGSAAKIGILVAVIVVIVAVVMNMGGDESEAPAVVDAVAVEEPAEPILLDYEKDEADSNEEAAEEEAAVEEAVPAISKECLAKQMELAEKCCGESKATWKDGKCDLQEDAQKSVFVECMTKNQPIAECEPPSEEKEEAPIPSNDELKRKMQLAQAAIKKGKFDTAEELYNGILKEAPDFAEATTALKALPGLKKAAEEAAKKKAAEEAAKKKAAEEAAKKKAAEEAAKKKAAEEAAKKKAAEEAAKKKASKDVKKKAAKKEKKAKKSPKKDVKKAKKTEKKEEKASKVDNTAKAKEMMKKGMGAMKAKNNRLALKYFQKAKKLAPKMKLIDKYIEKAKAAK